MTGLYLHIPFCEHKCIYCDFYSIAPDEDRSDGGALQEMFTERLLTEIRLRKQETGPVGMVSTVFFGGGTPSLLTEREAMSILEALHAAYDIAPDAEVTLEANPGTVSLSRLRAFRSMGFNRVSFGVQSFQEEELRFLTRIHTAGQAEKSVREAREAGFDNLSIDLMFSLPGQTPEKWIDNLGRAMRLNPDHLSCYSLTVEQNTPLARMVSSGQVQTLDCQTDADLYERTIDLLGENGYEQYEVSNFAKAGRRSRHNLNYWKHGEYIGFGPSAHSYRGGRRWWNIANLSTYTAMLGKQDLPVAGSEQLTTGQMMTELVFLGLRSDGVDLEQYRRRFGTSFLDDRHDAIQPLLLDGLANVRGTVLALTRRGYMVCDEICAALA